MVERTATLSNTQEQKLKKLPIQYIIPPSWMGSFVSWQVGKDLTPEGRKLVKEYVARIMRGEKVSACYEVPLVYKDAKIGVNTEVLGEIPAKGSLIVIGNHTKAGPLDGMAQFFEMVKVLAEARKGVPDDPFFVMQRGLTKDFAFIGGLFNSFSGQVYELAAKSLDWELVFPAKYDHNGQIINIQKFPQTAKDRFKNGGAGVILPQGRNRPDYNLHFPSKINPLISDFKKTEAMLLPWRVLRGNNGGANMYVGFPVLVREEVDSKGRFNINDFVQKYLAPLGTSTRSYSISGS